MVRQPPDDRLRGYGSFKREEIVAHLKDTIGRRAVSAAGRRLDQAGVAHKDRIEVGEPAETILRVASEEGCELLVVGAAPPNAIQRWLPKIIGLSIATLATQLVEAAPIPITVVK
jgi:nucleotide-binding universal stress UspA family protein